MSDPWGDGQRCDGEPSRLHVSVNAPMETDALVEFGGTHLMPMDVCDDLWGLYPVAEENEQVAYQSMQQSILPLTSPPSPFPTPEHVFQPTHMTTVQQTAPQSAPMQRCKNSHIGRRRRYSEVRRNRYMQQLAKLRAQTEEPWREFHTIQKHHLHSLHHVHMGVKARVITIQKCAHPDATQSFMHTGIIPSGSEDDAVPGVHPMLYPLLTELHVRLDQHGKLDKIWKEYKRNAASARHDCKLVQQYLASEHNHANPNFSNVGFMSKHAKDYVALLECTAFLKGCNLREAENTKNLWAAVSEIFDTTQHATILKHCYPFLIDPIQLLELLLDGHEETLAGIEPIVTDDVLQLGVNLDQRCLFDGSIL